MDMFLHQFDNDGVIHGPPGQGRGAFVSREDVARTVASVLIAPPGGIQAVTGPESITVGDVARRLFGMWMLQQFCANPNPGRMS